MKYNIYSLTSNNKPSLLFIPGWNNSINKGFIHYLSNYYSVLALSLEGIDPLLSCEKLYSTKEYVQQIKDILTEHNFVPELVIGHSCANKFIVQIDFSCPTILVAPSIFKPSFFARLKVKIKIRRNKIAKRLAKVFKITLSKKYLGSIDYQQTNENNRKLFLYLKDYYPSSFAGKKSDYYIIGYKNDSLVLKKNLLRGAKKKKLTKPLFFNGTHSSIYDNPEELINWINKNDHN